MDATTGSSLIAKQATTDKPGHSHLAYRGDIDGLRALAVVPVVLYHAGVRGFPGGFVGVDIFFVISGYLITGILLRDQALGRLSIAEFYRRRILRIFPALIVMTLVSSIGAIFWLLPGEWERYARSLAGSALFASNIIFYLATDYFNTGALSEPLLHTWSLAVEEQWYLVWPLLIGAIGAQRRGIMTGLISAIITLSLIYSIWLLPRDPSATFYLLPTRAWEMGLGAWLAASSVRCAPRILAEILSVIGILLIALSVRYYSDDIAFPGLAALPPCLGAILLIYANQSGTIVGRVLASPPFRYIGLISYSLYLWHWPVIVFAEGGLFVGHGTGAQVGMLTVSTILAYLSWRFIERPFRVGSEAWPTRKVLVGGGAVIAGLLAIAAVIPFIANIVTRYNAQDRQIAAYLSYDGDAAYRRGTCFRVTWQNRFNPDHCLATTGKPPILFVGDSHAAQLWPGLARYRDHFDIMQATTTGCVARIPDKGKPGGCEEVIASALTSSGWIAEHRPAALILASRWRLYSMADVEKTMRDPLVSRSHPLLVGPIPQYATELPRLIVAAHRRGDPELISRNLLEEPFEVDRRMREIASRTGTPYLSLIDLFCDARRQCRTLAAPGIPLQFDYGHVTTEGSALISNAIMSALKRHYPDDFSDLRLNAP